MNDEVVVTMVAQRVGDYRVTVLEDSIAISNGRELVFAYSAGDSEPINAQPSPGGQDARELLASAFDRHGLPASAGMIRSADYVKSSAIVASVDAVGCALAARQPEGENPAWRDELVREAYNRGLADGLNADRQPVGEVVVTKNDAGQIVAVTRKDDEHRILSVIAESAPAQTVKFERAIPTRRRESAVELLLQLGFVWNNQRWEDRRKTIIYRVRCSYQPHWVEVDEKQFHRYLSYGWEGQRLCNS